MKTAVVGHVEWAEFAHVERVPDPGDIVHATDYFELPAGGAAVAAVQIARLGGGCLFLTATGDDARADRVVSGLRERGLRVEAARRETAQRRAFVYLDADGERTITTIGKRVGPQIEDPLPWDELKDADAVYLTAGNADTVRAARAARNVVASVRTGPALAEAGVQVDVLVASANDRGEVYVRGEIDPEPRWVVRTDGARGGTLETAEGKITEWTSNPPSAAKVDTYGAGDTFAGGITYGLGRGFPIETAIAFGAFCGASSVRGRGPYAGHVSPEELAEWERGARIA
ncbi:MAG TPA: PfkB family carbohydrate kinase [Solirubrobacterales bacterium]|nr:PfkB family carbohydrate kinase [Solirubrobacterales bacterium]